MKAVLGTIFKDSTVVEISVGCRQKPTGFHKKPTGYLDTLMSLDHLLTLSLTLSLKNYMVLLLGSMRMETACREFIKSIYRFLLVQ